MKKLVFGLLVAVSLVLSVGCAFATVDISQTHWQLPERGFSGGSRVYPVDTVLTYTDLSALRNSLNDSMQSRSAQLTYSGSFYFITMVRDGDIYWLCNGNGGRYRTAVESTDEPSSTVNNFNQTIINNSSGSASGSTGSPYVSSSWQEKELLGKIYEKLWFINEWLQITKDWVKEVNYNVKNVNTNINNNVVPALVAINKNLSSMLTDTVSRLSSIDRGYIPGVTSKHLPEKPHRKQRKCSTVKAARAPKGLPIDHRPEDIANRKTFGHWEFDSVIGKAKGQKQSILTLTERKTRFEIIFRATSKTSAATVCALNKIIRQFPQGTFQTITVDNGSEFQDCYGMEHDKQGNKRLTVYYAHPYSSWERGTNERNNRIIRRYFPKGKSMNRLTQKDCDKVAASINAMPRKILDWCTAQELFERELANLQNPQQVDL